MNPLVSFVIPVFNAELFVAQAIDSVLNCGYHHIEVLLIDDGSTDSSFDICKLNAEKSSLICLLQHENKQHKGTSLTRKLGIDNAKGELIYFLDADDTIIKGELSNYVNVFLENLDVVLIHGDIKTFGEIEAIPNPEIGFVIGYSNKKYLQQNEPYFLKSDRICTSTVCVRKSALDGINFNFNKIFPMGEDWLMKTLLSEKGYFYYFSHPIVNYRIHKNSATYMAHQKGDIYLKYNLIEFYLCLLTNTISELIKNIVILNLEEVMSDVYKLYQENSNLKRANNLNFKFSNNNDGNVFILKNKLYGLERGWGYYFYFIYRLKNFWRKWFLFKTKI